MEEGRGEGKGHLNPPQKSLATGLLGRCHNKKGMVRINVWNIGKLTRIKNN